ncbi:SMP-30/gluconolactonase/LRE family protein [Sorangium sp. So ce204]|uniref:SMP-30/gluconolactonase/LRE family protein n=1 Tax=Sorangium sp. So ce204 TaxID=3133288 RepID=UPI003F616503
MSQSVTSKSSHSNGKWLACGALAILSAVSPLIPGPALAQGGYYGEIKTFATFPAAPGFPEGIAVHGNRVYVSGPAMFGTAGQGPSKIIVFDRDTKIQKSTIVVAGEMLAEEHALSCIAVDDDGRVYALSTQLGLLRFTKTGHGYVQESYGDPLPDLPPCVMAAPGEACSPAPFPAPPLPNDIAFDEEGYAYVTDSMQATIFRYPPGGGAPEIWFQSSALVGSGDVPIGVNGIRLDPEREHVYFSVSFSPSDPSLGSIYRLPLVEAPEEADLELVHDYDAGEAPDGFAFGKSGKLYVTLAAANAISVLNKHGVEVSRIESAPGDEMPLDAPANVAFNDPAQTLLIVNHASFTMNPAHFGVLRVWVGDKADPLEKPSLP